MAHITEGLQHTSFSDTTVSSTGQSVVALKPGAAYCVFQPVEVQANGPATCSQFQISGNAQGTSSKQCYIADDDPAANYPVCYSSDLCPDTMMGNTPNVTMI